MSYRLLDDCPDCFGYGRDDDGVFCIPCDGAGLVCAECGLPDIECDCEADPEE